MSETLGSLVDKLVTVNLKTFMAVQTVQTETDDAKVAAAARKVQDLNRQRNDLIDEIDQLADASLQAGSFPVQRKHKT